MNDAFYQLLIDGKKVVDGYSVLGLEYLILFKIRAWLDLSDRVTGGETIDSNDVKKHKNDVFRLFPFIAPTTIIPVEADIKKDVDLFLKRIPADPPDLRNLGIRSITLDQVLETIQRWYKLKD